MNLPERLKLHPKAIELLSGPALPLQGFVGKRGWVTLPMVVGASPDDGDGGTDPGAGGTDSSGAGSEGEAGTDGSEGKSGEEEGDGKRPVTREEFETLQRQLSASDKKKSELEKKLQEQDRAKLDEAERTKLELQDARKENERLQSELSDSRVQLAWATAAGGVEWHDADDALTIAKRKGAFDEVTNEDGTVDGKKLKKKVEEFVKANPHLVKASPNGSGQAPPPGDHVGSKGKKTGTDTSDEALKTRYRLLRQ
jgi:hypothetical protein